MAAPKKIAITNDRDFVPEAPAPALPSRRIAITDEAAFIPEGASASPEQEEPGKIESALRGLKQGVTFGFGDEVTGALESAFTDKTYEQARDEARARDKAAKEAHPWLYGGGEIGGGLATALVPGVGALGAAGKGASLGARFAANAARGAGAGILTGAGESEAKDVGGVVSDAAKGGLVGGLTGGVLGTAAESVLAGAQGRVDKRLMATLGEKAKKEQRDALAAIGEQNVVSAAREAGIESVAKKPAAVKKAVDFAVQNIADETAGVQRAIDTKVGQYDGNKIIAALSKERDRLAANPATQARAEKYDRLIERVRDTWMPEPAPPPPTGRDILAAATKGAGSKTKERLGAKAEDVEKVITKWKLGDAALTDPERFASGTATAKTAVGKAIGDYDEAIEAASHGIPLTDIMKSLHGVEQAYDSNPATKDVAKIIARKIESVRDSWQDVNVMDGVAHVPISKVREFTSRLAESGFAGSQLDPKVTARIQRQAWGAMKDLIEDHAENTISRMHRLGFRGFTAKPGQYSALNREYSILTDLDKVAQRRAMSARLQPAPAAAAPVGPPKTGAVSPEQVRSFAQELGDHGAPINDLIAQESQAAAPDAFAHMQQLAQKRKTLEAIGDAADYRAKASPFPVTGLRDIAKKAAGPALVAATGHPWGAAALLAAPLAKAGLRASDRALAQLVAASRAGQIPAQLVQQAIEAGVPRGLFERLASGVATQQPAPDEAAAAP